MIRSQSSVARDPVGRQRQMGQVVVAFVLGLPLAAGLYWAVFQGPLQVPLLQRYLSHPLEAAEVVLFCLALVMLLAKLVRCLALERTACRHELLPHWDGRAVPVRQSALLLEELERLPRQLAGTWLATRFRNVLEFVRGRGSADGLDEHLRTLADNDGLALENSYAFTRFLAWAIPILGFLGTVLGITEAVSGVTPEVLENELSRVTDGLALAFDTTALALGLTMVVMFLSFLVERAEQGVLESVDQTVERELAHRFERGGNEANQFVAALRQQSDVLLQATEQLVQRQASIWAKTLEEADRRRSDSEQRQQEQLSRALETALERTLEAHSRRLTVLEKQASQQNLQVLERLAGLAGILREQQAELSKVGQQFAASAESLARLQQGEQHLLRLQELLQQNLATLAAAGSFDQAVQSLTAAIHLLTARSGPSLTVRSQPRAAA